MRNLVAMLLVMICSVFMCSDAYSDRIDEVREDSSDEIITYVEPFDNYYRHVEYKNGMYLDWDGFDEYFILKLITYKGGSIEDRAYNMMVTLNRMVDVNYPEDIQEVVKDELYNYNGLTPDDYLSIIPDEDSRKAVDMVVFDGWDDTNGDLDYR